MRTKHASQGRLLPSSDVEPYALDVALEPISQNRDNAVVDVAITPARARSRVEQLRAWALAVKTRDQWKDQKTGVRVLSTRSLDPLRAEAHHIVAKSDHAVRYDVRNGICLSLATHLAVETFKLRIEGTVYFTVGGQRYVNANFPVFFVRL